MDWNAFYVLLLAHIVADFYLQNDKSCQKKFMKGPFTKIMFVHAAFVFALTWLLSWNAAFVWCAALAALLHWTVDALKWRVERIEIAGKVLNDGPHVVHVFVVDQLLHVASLFMISALWNSANRYVEVGSWMNVFNDDFLLVIPCVLFLGKPSNILIKLIFRQFTINNYNDDTVLVGQDNECRSASVVFKSGALIGTLERLIVFTFVIIHQYDAIGLLVAAKTILRFKELKEPEQSEYVLVGTLLSILIALVLGYLVS